MRTGSLAIALMLLASGRAAAVEDEWKPVRAWACGTEHDVWVISEGAAQGSARLPVIQMWYAGSKPDAGAMPAQKPALPPITGRILDLGTDSAALRVLFTDLSTGDYFPARTWAAGAS